MRVIRDFACDTCDEIFERWTESTALTQECPHCGAECTHIISGTSFRLPGHDTGFPTSADKWARRHRNANKTELQNLGLPT